MVLTTLPWLTTGMYWALPILTVLCPSERYYIGKGKPQKKLTAWASQTTSWMGRKRKALQRPVYLIGDGSFAALGLFMDAKRREG